MPKKDEGKDPRAIVVGKKGVSYLSFPILAAACDGQGTVVVCGGGGKTAANEVPNTVLALRLDPTKGTLNVVDHVGFGTELPNRVTYNPQQRCFHASVGRSLHLLKLREGDSGPFDAKLVADGGVLSEVDLLEKAELKKRKMDVPGQNVSRECGYKMVAIGGTDCKVRFYGYQRLREHVDTTHHIPALGEVSYDAEVTDLHCNFDGTMMLTAVAGQGVIVTNVMTYQKVRKLSFPDQATIRCNMAQFCSLTEIVVGGSGPRGPGLLQLQNVETGATLAQVEIDKKPLACVEVCADRVVVGCATGKKAVVDIKGELEYDDLRMKVATGLQKVAMTDEVHQLSCGTGGMLTPTLAVSCSGDYSVHLGPLLRQKAAVDFGDEDDSSFAGAFCGTLVYLLVLTLMAAKVVISWADHLEEL